MKVEPLPLTDSGQKRKWELNESGAIQPTVFSTVCLLSFNNSNNLELIHKCKKEKFKYSKDANLDSKLYILFHKLSDVIIVRLKITTTFQRLA